MTLRVPEFICCDAARGSGQQLGPISRNRFPILTFRQSCVRRRHIGYDDGEMLKERATPRNPRWIGLAGWSNGSEFDRLFAELRAYDAGRCIWDADELAEGRLGHRCFAGPHKSESGFIEICRS